MSGQCITTFGQIQSHVRECAFPVGTTDLTGIVQGLGGGDASAILGTAGYLPKWSATAPYLTTTSNVYDNGTNVGIHTTTPTSAFEVVGNPYTHRAGPSFMEFRRTDLAGTARASVGMLGTGEANLSHNMDYTDGVHRYYDATQGAVWLAMHSGAWAIQYAPSGLAADIWTSAGSPYGIYGVLATGQLMLGATLATVTAGYSAQFTLPRPGGSASIAGVTDLVLEGHKTTGTTGIVYINTYNAGDVYLANGGGNVGVGLLVPLARFHVYNRGVNGLGPAFTAILQSDAKTVNDAVTLHFHALNSTTTSQNYGSIRCKIIDPTTASVDSELQLWSYQADTNTQRLTIDFSGNMGVGVAAPTARIHAFASGFNGVGVATVGILQSDARTVNDGVALNFYALDSAIAAQDYGSLRFKIIDPTAASEDSEFQIWNYQAGTGFQRFTIDNLGQVGVGASTPLAKFHVYRTGVDIASFAQVMFIQTDAKTIGHSFGINFYALDSVTTAQDYGSLRFKIIDPTTTSEDSEFQIWGYQAGANTQRFTIDNLGNTGVGAATIDASAKLQVDSVISGVLPPRMTKAQRDAIGTPADGLIVYQTDGTAGLKCRVGGAWMTLDDTADP